MGWTYGEKLDEGAFTMTAVFPLFKNGAFPPEATHVMGEAFDLACLVFNDGRLPTIVKEAIANRVIAEAFTGERDRNRLLMGALRGMSI
jgi:hypothetical protein